MKSFNIISSNHSQQDPLTITMEQVISNRRQISAYDHRLMKMLAYVEKHNCRKYIYAAYLIFRVLTKELSLSSILLSYAALFLLSVEFTIVIHA